MEMTGLPVAPGNLDSGQQAVLGGNAGGDDSRISRVSRKSRQQCVILRNEVIAFVGDVMCP